MTWSLGEIESLARKATRGAGYCWGHAEEAGKAVRWLCGAGLPGEMALAGVLQRNDGQPHDRICPVDTTAMPWQARAGALCPLISGASLCDLAGSRADTAMARVSFPLLLLPYVIMMAERAGAPMRLAWQGAQFSINGESTFMEATPEARLLPEAQMLRVHDMADPPSGTPLVRGYRATIDPPSAEVLEGFARRTYAPETEASRLSGAGAGLTDND